MLMGKTPVYISLRVFGCSCYPCLRPYAKENFDPKSLLYVFLGYNEKYKGYRCFYPPTNKVYISIHVLFDKEKFPFENIYKYLQSSLDTLLFSAWDKLVFLDNLVLLQPLQKMSQLYKKTFLL